MSEKPSGKTFNIKEAVGKKPDSKSEWKTLGRAFVREDLTGGALWEGSGEAEKTYGLHPREGTPKGGGKSFDVKEKGAEGVHGRLFIRSGLSGGAYWVGSGDEEKEYAVFTAGKPKAAAAGGASVAGAAPAKAVG